MPTPPLSDELAKEAADAWLSLGDKTAAAALLKIPRNTFNNRLKRASERGMLGTKPVMPGFRIAKVSNTPRGDYIQQKPEHGEQFAVPEGHVVKGVSALVGPDGRVIQEWRKTHIGATAHLEAMRQALEGFKDDLPLAFPVTPPAHGNADLLCQYTITDLHLGMLAWAEETGDEDYDLSIAERLLEDWFAAAIDLAPNAHTAVLAQIGDLLHHDSHESVTPAHRHILDADSRFQKMVRVAIRVLRRIVRRLLAKHERVHIIMADANHDPASGAWLREMFAAFYDGEPRVTVDRTAGTYYCHQWGDVSLYYHHGHRRKVGNVDSVFAGRFREIYGNTKFSYAHIGHLHSDELKTTNLMKVERHETLAAPDAYAANGGWLSGRSAKVITYHKQHGEVGRLTLTPNMVAGAARKVVAANDNEPRRMVG